MVQLAVRHADAMPAGAPTHSNRPHLSEAEKPLVDVIVPVYRGLAQTRSCIDSVLTSRCACRFELVLIDDSSPEPALSAYVDSLRVHPGVTVARNPTNLGFVATVNRGMAMHPDRDVILLNSDTRVANDWVDRLRSCALAEPRVATATPFSNSATVCSYPFEGWSGGVPGALGLAALDALFAHTLAGEWADLPTAVGFCMYIRRSALVQVGLFDVERFGRGYGEENDFCMRAAKLGWHHRLAADVFVYHEGSVSFANQREALQQQAMRALLDAHPDYLEQVERFIARDPLARLRERIDRARCAFGAREEARVLQERGRLRHDFTWPAEPEVSTRDLRPVQLHVAHNWGGGTSRWIEDFCIADRERRNLLLRSAGHRNAAAFRLELVDPGAGDALLGSWDLDLPIRACSFDHPEYAALLAGVVQEFEVRSVVVSSLIGHSLEALDSGLPTALVLHDLFPFCPALFGFFGNACSACDRARLEACLAGNPFNAFWHNTTADDWLQLRSELAARLQRNAIRIVAPSNSVIGRWITLLPALAEQPVAQIPHGIERAALGPAVEPAPPGNRKLRLVVPGRLLPHKGMELLRAALPSLAQGAELLLLGSGVHGQVFENLPGVRVVRDYRLDSLGRHLREYRPDAALLLSVLPESFSYTLSEMHALGLPVLATRVGAFAERISEGETGLLFDPAPEALKKCVAGLTPALLAHMRSQVRALPVRERSETVAAINRLLPVPIQPSHAPSARCLGLGVARARLRADLLAHAEVEQAGTLRHYTGLLALRDAHLADLEARNRALESRLQELTSERERSPKARHWTQRLRRIGAQPSAIEPPAEAPAPTRYDARLPALAEHRAEIRARIRYWLGIPDATRIVLSLGGPASAAEAARIMAVAEVICARRNDVCIVVTGSEASAASWSALQQQTLALTVRRRLFFVPNVAEEASWLLASDVLLISPEGRATQGLSDAAALLGWPLDDADSERLCTWLDALPPAPPGLPN